MQHLRDPHRRQGEPPPPVLIVAQGLRADSRSLGQFCCREARRFA